MPLKNGTQWTKETIFKEKPHEFKKKILALKPNLKQGEREQPCET